jgi:hypothetical protein
MKTGIQRRFAFIGKSLLWSILLYVVFMLVFNWDEVSNTVSGKNAVTVSNNQQMPQLPGTNNPVITPANISAHTGVFKSIVRLMKTITGIASVSAPH